jgi:hypothetical protein
VIETVIYIALKIQRDILNEMADFCKTRKYTKKTEINDVE